MYILGGAFLAGSKYLVSAQLLDAIRALQFLRSPKPVALADVWCRLPVRLYRSRSDEQETQVYLSTPSRFSAWTAIPLCGLHGDKLFFTPMRTLLLVACWLPTVLAGETDTSYFRDVRPILQRQCQGCHQPAVKSSGLDLTSFDALNKGGKHGPAFHAGDPAGSLIVKYIKGEQKPAMPLGAAPLTARTDRVHLLLDCRWREERHTRRGEGQHLAGPSSSVPSAAGDQRSRLLARR